ncbi:MAG: PsbP-related protein, partial [Methanobacteriaceae archaeon]|nr:PsbP-related protein [Methanobacteriaceae archaeon]
NKINNSFSLKEQYSSVKENNKKKLAKYCYEVISEKTMKVDGTEAYEIIYKIGCDDTQTRQLHRNIILEKKGYIYSLSCTVIPPEEFDNQKINLDIIIESFHVK